MNGKRAKELRHVARGLTVGKPEREYASRYTKVEIEDARTGKKRTEIHENVRLKPECTRAAYQFVKRQYLNRLQGRAG